ncbi:MAG: homoserine dehydrogenase [Anaerolineae bacterium]|nr:homoserine dehydrogenase [Anaerolineae bacterium]
MELSLGLVGFGNVGRALAQLIEMKNPMLRTQYNLNLSVMGVVTARHGCAIDPHGLDISRVLETVQHGSINAFHVGDPINDTQAFIRKVPADVIVETTVLNPKTGQPAIDHIRAALRTKRHVVTANKGPVAFAYQELRNMAESNKCAFLFESTVMDGVPVFSLVRESLPAIDVQRIRGILNSTTNSILTRMADGVPFESALREMQEAGLAEANPDHDVDGWDAATKIAILANVLMSANLRPTEVDRTGIRGITVEEMQAAKVKGQTIRLVCEAFYDNGAVRASVRPTTLNSDDPLALVRGTGNDLILETDMIGYLAIGEDKATPMTTAYGLLVDIVNIARGHYR